MTQTDKLPAPNTQMKTKKMKAIGTQTFLTSEYLSQKLSNSQSQLVSSATQTAPVESKIYLYCVSSDTPPPPPPQYSVQRDAASLNIQCLYMHTSLLPLTPSRHLTLDLIYYSGILLKDPRVPLGTLTLARVPLGLVVLHPDYSAMLF